MPKLRKCRRTRFAYAVKILRQIRSVALLLFYFTIAVFGSAEAGTLTIFCKSTGSPLVTANTPIGFEIE
jgi:hypothetical protein